jgi:tetratricopeptide (TPR) repeat protein
METQLDFAFLQPAARRGWREWWIPLRGLGGLTCASPEAGAFLKLAPDAEEGMANLTIGVCSARDFGDSVIEVSTPGKTLIAERTHLSPEKPWQVTRALPTRDLAGYPTRITVAGQDGTLILDYTLDRDPSAIPADKHEPGASPKTSQEYYQQGLKHENFDNREQALTAYRKAVELSSENGEANFRLGLMLLRAGDFPKAREHLLKAISQNLLAGNYYLGLISQLEGQPRDAAERYRTVPEDDKLSALALLGLGTVAMQAKNWGEAISYFEQAVQHDGHSISAALLLGMAQRRNGQNEEAIRGFEWVLSVDPLNHPALRELALIQPAGEYQRKLARLLADDRQYYMDLACSYLGAGLIEDALAIVEGSYNAWPYPMLGYLAAYIEHALGHGHQSRTWLERAAAGSPECVFPSRIEEYNALNYALHQTPQDYKARYYLGNFLYARQRHEEGVRQWQEALPGLADFDVLYRNLGLAAWQRQRDLPKAIQLFEQALTINPLNQDLYLHLDDLYKALDLVAKREILLEKILTMDNPREDVHKRSIAILVDLGRYEEALRIMQTEHFVPLEMDQSFHDLYVRALLQRAAGLEQVGHVEEAIADYQHALEFPRNLGVGRPTTLSQARIYYLLGLAYERLGRFNEGLMAWRNAATEHHPHSSELYEYVQMALDKLSCYSELGFKM